VSLTDAANTNFSGTFKQANNSSGNYVLFTITGTQFTITATPGASGDTNPRAPVNAIQIVPSAAAPPPVEGNSGNVGIKFVGQGTPMASSEVAGVVAQSNWNNASGTSSTSGLALLNQSGTVTGATVTWSTNGIWALPITDTAGNDRMMRGYLDTVGGTTTVTVTGLPTNAAGYNVYVYADGDNGTVSRAATYQISGPGLTTTSVSLTDAANTNFSGTFKQANNSSGNYVLFTITSTQFTITAIPGASTDTNPRAPVNAIQIVPQ
jgi:hypothetical protein